MSDAWSIGPQQGIILPASEARKAAQNLSALRPGGLSRILVLPRSKATRLDIPGKYAVVSIHDPAPDGEPAKIPQRWGLVAVQWLAFHDFDLNMNYPPGIWDKERHGRRLHDWAMTRTHAREVWDFVRTHWQQIETLVVHCEAGVSRSPSVAMAVADAYALGRDAISWDNLDPDGDPPNGHVYDTMMKTFKTG